MVDRSTAPQPGMKLPGYYESLPYPDQVSYTYGDILQLLGGPQVLAAVRHLSLERIEQFISVIDDASLTPTL